MEKQSVSYPKAWNPVVIGLLSFFFTFLPAGIFYAINFERLGQVKKKNLSLVLVILGFVIYTVAVFLIPEDAPTIQIFTLINAAISGFFIFSQNTLYKQHLDKGGEKAPVLFPVLLSIVWFAIISSLFLFREPSELDLNPEKAFIDAADSGDINIIRHLIERGIDINIDYKGRTALYTAATEGETEIVKLLLQEGADPNVGDHDGLVTPLYMVAMENRGGFEKTNEIIKLLVDGGADMDTACTYSNITPLMWVAGNGNIEGVRYLVEKGADINIKDEDGQTALGYAIKARDNTVIVEYLKKIDSEVNNNESSAD